MTAMQRDVDSLMNAFMPGLPSMYDPFRRPMGVLDPFGAMTSLEGIGAGKALPVSIDENVRDSFWRR